MKSHGPNPGADDKSFFDHSTCATVKCKHQVPEHSTEEDEGEEEIVSEEEAPSRASALPSEAEEDEDETTAPLSKRALPSGRRGGTSRLTSRAPSPDVEVVSACPTGRSSRGKGKATSSAFATPTANDDVFSKIAARAASTVAKSSRSRGGGKSSARKPSGESVTQ
jgi:hypothetical protein